MVIVHSRNALDKLRESGRIVALVHRELKKLIVPGITTLDLEEEAKRIIKQEGGVPVFLGYRGYPFATCCSVNEEIVHGFPNKRKLQDGDLLSVDVGVIKNSYCGDSARSFQVGETTEEGQRLIKATEGALNAAISVIKEGVTTGTIGRVIEQYSSNLGYSVVRNLVGHGIGKQLHMEPSVYNYGKDDEGVVLKSGMCLCVEPMLCVGSASNHRLADGWTVVTNDGKLAAHAEHQIIVHKDYGEVISI